MGCSYSSLDSSPPSDCVRVIRITGHVEDLRAPVTAGQLTGRPPKDVLFSGAHLSAFGSNPLRPDDRLEPGRVYFLLPHAVLRSESSAVDLAALMARLLAAAARRGPSPCHRRRLPSRSAGSGSGRGSRSSNRSRSGRWKGQELVSSKRRLDCDRCMWKCRR